MSLSRPDDASPPRLVTPVFVSVTVSTFVYFLGVGALLPVLPRYVKGPLGGTSFDVGLVVGAFSFASVLLRPVSGRLGDRRGRALLMISGAAIVACGVAAYHLAAELWSLIALRTLNGVGEALFFVGAASAINDLAPDDRRGEAVSLFSLAFYAGIALGPVLGESVLGNRRFGAVWWVSAALCTAAAALALRIPDTRPESEAGSGSGRLVHRAGLVPGTALGASVWGFAAFTAFVPLYALTLGMSGSRFVFMEYSVVIFAIRSIGARLPDKLGASLAARLALSFGGIGLFVMWAWGSPAGLYAGTFVWALGQALAFPALMTIAVASAPPGERGAVVGTFTAFFDFAFGVGAVSVGAVANAFGYRGTFASSGLVAVAGLVLLIARVRAPAEHPA